LSIESLPIEERFPIRHSSHSSINSDNRQSEIGNTRQSFNLQSAILDFRIKQYSISGFRFQDLD